MDYTRTLRLTTCCRKSYNSLTNKKGAEWLSDIFYVLNFLQKTCSYLWIPISPSNSYFKSKWSWQCQRMICKWYSTRRHIDVWPKMVALRNKRDNQSSHEATAFNSRKRCSLVAIKPNLTKGGWLPPLNVFFSWHSKTLYFYAKWFLTTARESFTFAVTLMQKAGCIEPSRG